MLCARAKHDCSLFAASAPAPQNACILSDSAAVLFGATVTCDRRPPQLRRCGEAAAIELRLAVQLECVRA
jgi:hypothetical protein